MVTNWVQRRGSDRDVERRTRQIKEIIRLGTALRAEQGLDVILGQVVEAISATLSFQVAVLNLVHPDHEHVEVVATAGLTEAERQRLVKSPPQVARLLAVMRPEFCISHSYFISHHYKHLFDGVEGVTVFTPTPPSAQRAPDAWHPEDVLLIPLVSPREDRLLGILSLDQPEDGKVPSLDAIEIIELFASQAALAIDSSQLFEERELERQSLESGLFELLYHLEQVRQGNMDVRVQLSATTLSPMAESLNAVLQTLSGLLTDVRAAGEVVSANAAEMREAATQLASSAQHQAQQILEVSSAVEGMAGSVSGIAKTASDTSGVAEEAIEISNVGREAAERAAEGMSAVREMALQSVKKIKRLGESAQDIGEIVQMVSDFASQTNLLALNAAIEAARAGENGRGFSIVAQEIRNLATSSAEATKQIHARIKGIQMDTHAVVVAIEHSTQQVVVQSDLAAQAGAALGAVDMVTKRIANAIGEMNETATRQASAAEMISQSMTDIAEITAQTRDGMEQMRGSMDRLVELAQSLLGSISVFRLGENNRAYLPVLLPAATDSAALADRETEPVPAVGEVADGGWMRRAGSFSAVVKGGVTTQLPRSTYPVHPPVVPGASTDPAEAQQGDALGLHASVTSGPLADSPPAAQPPNTSRPRGDSSPLPPLDRHPGP
jgi:methyl-accepting chemotaxis protein